MKTAEEIMAGEIKKANIGESSAHVRARPGDDAWMSRLSKAGRPAAIGPSSEELRARRARSIAIAVSLGVLTILFYIVTLVKGPGVLVRPL